MKKLVFVAAVAAIAASASLTSAQAFPGKGNNGQIGGINPGNSLPGGIGSGGFPKNPGCCGGWTGNKGWGGGFGGGISVGLVSGVSDGDCYYVRRAVLVPNIGVVSRRQLVCE